MKKTTVLSVALLAATFATSAFATKPAQDPHAVAPRTIDWLCAMNTSDFAQVSLTNAGLIDQTKVDYHKTEVRLLLKKSFGGGRYEQVFYMTLHQTDGKSISIVTDSTTESDGECPGSGIKIFVVSRVLGEWPSHDWLLPPKPSSKP
jgi:hypothetical protein